MASNVRISPEAHAVLSELAAKHLHVSLTDTITRAAEALRREVFFAELAAGYVALSPEERAREEAERAAWDVTNLDGLEIEPPYPVGKRSKRKKARAKRSRSG